MNHVSPMRKNPFSAFGENVATKLLGYNKFIRAEVEFKISKVLYEADLAMLQSEGGPSTSTTSSDTVYCDKNNGHNNVYADVIVATVIIDEGEEQQQ